jgi:hypothetical protein
MLQKCLVIEKLLIAAHSGPVFCVANVKYPNVVKHANTNTAQK